MVLYCTDNKTDRANGSVDDILCDLPSACQFFQRSAWIVFSSDLQGGHDMDRHVCVTPLAKYMLATLALQTIWYSNFRRNTSHLIASYGRCLQRFPAHLQQLITESNGQSALRLQIVVKRIMPPDLKIWGDAITIEMSAQPVVSSQKTKSKGCSVIPALLWQSSK